MLSFHLEMQLFLFFFSFQDEKCSLLNRLKIRVALILWKEALIFRVSYSLKYSFFPLSFDDREEQRFRSKILFALHALYEKSRKNKFGVYFWVVFVLKIISGSKEDNDFYFSYKRLFSRYSMTNWWIAYHLETSMRFEILFLQVSLEQPWMIWILGFLLSCL